MRFGSLTFEDVKDHILAAAIVILGVYFLTARDQNGLQNLRTVSVVVTSYLEQPLASIRLYRTALQTNAELQRRNILLNDELSQLRSSQKELESLREMIGLRKRTKYDLVPVLVVGKTTTGLARSITIDAGATQGVEVGMPLITSKGLVGNVIIVGQDFSQVLPYNHPMFRASARIQGNRASGIVSFFENETGRIQMLYVPTTIKVEPGDIAETSGYSFNFPAGIPIGSIISSRPFPGRDYQQIFIEPFQAMTDLTEGFILKFQPDSAIVKLRNQFEDSIK